MTNTKTRRRGAVMGMAAILAAIALSALPSLAAADGIPSSGEFALRYTFVNTTTSNFGPVDRGVPNSGQVAEAGDWMAWLMTKDGSEGFGHKMTGKCIGMTRSGPNGFDLVAGNCVYTDQDGDQILENYDGLKGSWTGGTGKYSGISGNFDLTDIVFATNNGYAMLSGVKVGSYTLP